jgi:hypothetical protein
MPILTVIETSTMRGHLSALQRAQQTPVSVI